ncbi:MAG: Gfo/Idh/MocA family oxidoreductase [Verrucomicrobia bacterium]|nr:Gfo/Idh/MocA family oxidoreductase [Verrucomicrobiota bacterium]
MPPQLFHISRRHFLQRSTVALAATGLPAWFLEQHEARAATKPLSPNDRPSIALIGCGGRGRGIGKEAAAFGNMVAICDVDSKNLDQAALMFPGATKFKDFRKLIARDDIHAIINGTPDHWHTLVNIHALKSGKDVYSEKPLTRTIGEGRRLVEVVKRTKRLLQTGSQQRSDARFRLACELVRNGRLGRLRHVITSLPAGRHGGPFAMSPVPPELDWDFWQGPVAKVDYVKERCHGNFRYWYDYSGGTMTDWGAHHNDIALWGIGLERSGPVTIEGRPLIDEVPGGFTAASQYRVEYTYANGVTHTCQSTTSDNPGGGKVNDPKAGEMAHGVRFEGPEGWIFVTRGKIEASKPELLEIPLPSNAQRLYVSDKHIGNFFDCIRSRRQPICEAEIGHRSVSVCHLGVLAIRLGRKLKWDPAKEHFVGDKAADAFILPPMRKPWTLDSV